MEITPDLITQFGLISKVSTGHAYLDMLVVLLVPILLKSLGPWLAEFASKYIFPDRTPKEIFNRTIEHKKMSEYWWYDNDGPSNTILQKALLNFINTHSAILDGLPAADFQIKNKPQEVVMNMSGDEYEDEVNEKSNEHNYDVNVAPPNGVWIDLKNGIKFMRNTEALDDKNKNIKITYHLQSDKDNGNKLIDAFVQEALDLYRKQQAAKVDYSRYLYIPVLTGWMAAAASSEEGGNKASAVYKRYKLSEEKRFESFFHPDKEAILGLVNQFLKKKGKFAIAGYPQKLGFLLYGPPGTGKTSFIKALAQYTKRSVISIPLSKIRTNQELTDIMMDQKIKIDGEDCINLPYSKTIFVMEDVDAASNVVQRRAAPTALETAAAEAAVRATLQHKAEMAKKEAGTDAGGDAEIEVASDSEGDGKGKKKKAFGPSMPIGMGRSLFGGDDDLNLAGLLNVLDGVVDTPNRIVIMTTNHPEKLDPALIRPGRINKKIYMGRICAGEALCMMGHYFGPVDKSTAEQLRAVFVDEALSPAELESMCAEFESPELLVDHLALKFSLAAQAAASMGGPAVPTAGVNDCYVKAF